MVADYENRQRQGGIVSADICLGGISVDGSSLAAQRHGCAAIV
jgi:hypothetical protein